MDKETARYIINYFSDLLTIEERMAIKHTSSTMKLNASDVENTIMRNAYKKAGWLTSDQNILDLLKEGYDKFELNVANRILVENPSKVFFNNCPICNKLARTPSAQQCRFCGHDWHNSSKISS